MVLNYKIIKRFWKTILVPPHSPVRVWSRHGRPVRFRVIRARIHHYFMCVNFSSPPVDPTIARFAACSVDRRSIAEHWSWRQIRSRLGTTRTILLKQFWWTVSDKGCVLEFYFFLLVQPGLSQFEDSGMLTSQVKSVSE